MLNSDYREMLQLLSDEGAEYMVVGAYALAAHGYPRATGDLDIWINSSPANAARVYKALHRFGAPLNQLTEGELTRSNMVFQIGVAPRRIDILTSITAVEFSDADREKTIVEIEGLRIPFISPRELIQNKDATGRPKDIEDAARLRELFRK
jgi:hypothetical protein